MPSSVVLSEPREMCVTFYWPELAQDYIGYRFAEAEPRFTERPIQTGTPAYVYREYTAQASPVEASHSIHHILLQPGWLTDYRQQAPNDPYQLNFQSYPDGSADCSWQINGGQQNATLTFQPQSNGILLHLRLTTGPPIPGAFCLQQCLRFTGVMNDPWRQGIAHVPFLSEYDMQAMGNANATLTWSRRANQWLPFPVPHTVFSVANASTDEIAVSNGEIDHGLIVRESPSRELAPDWYFQRVAPTATWEQVSSGLFWERSVFVSNRHPADCVHAWVDLGPLAAGDSRLITGKFYFIEGSKDDLLAQWQTEFANL